MSAAVLERTTVGWQDFQAIGLTHRRFLYWVRFDYLRPAEGTHRGSGVPMQFAPEELAVARWMIALTTWGMELAAAADYARDPWLRQNLAEILLSFHPTAAAPASAAVPLSQPPTTAPGEGDATVPP